MITKRMGESTKKERVETLKKREEEREIHASSNHNKRIQ